MATAWFRGEVELELEDEDESFCLTRPVEDENDSDEEAEGEKTFFFLSKLMLVKYLGPLSANCCCTKLLEVIMSESVVVGVGLEHLKNLEKFLNSVFR